MNLDPWPFYVDDGHFRVGNAGCNPCSAGLIWNMLHSQNIICASVHVQWNGQIYKLTVHLPSVSVCTSKGEKQRKWQTWWEATSGELLFFGDYNNNLQLECSKFLTLWITERTTDIIHLLRRWTTGHELGNHAITFNPWRYLAFQDIILFYTYMSNGYCPFMYLIFLDFGNVRVINCGQQQHHAASIMLPAWVLYIQWTWNLEQECGYVAWNSAGFTPLPLKALFDSWRQWQQTTVAEACWEEGWMIQEHLRQLSASTLSSRMCSHTGGSECGTGSWGKDQRL